MIMDEIDSGLGSRLGTSVGCMLRSMASSQILCISHLAQVFLLSAWPPRTVWVSMTPLWELRKACLLSALPCRHSKLLLHVSHRQQHSVQDRQTLSDSP